MPDPTTPELRRYAQQGGSARQALGRTMAAPISWITDPTRWPLIGGLISMLIGMFPGVERAYRSFMNGKDDLITGFMSNIVLGVVDKVAPGVLDSVENARRGAEAWVVEKIAGAVGDTPGTALAARTLVPGMSGANVALNPEMAATVTRIHGEIRSQLQGIPVDELQRAVSAGVAQATVSLSAAWDSATETRDANGHALHAAAQVHKEVFHLAQRRYLASQNIIDPSNLTGARLAQYTHHHEPRMLAYARATAEMVSGVTLLGGGGNEPVFKVSETHQGVRAALLPHTTAIAQSAGRTPGTPAPAPATPSLAPRADAQTPGEQQFRQLAAAADATILTPPSEDTVTAQITPSTRPAPQNSIV